MVQRWLTVFKKCSLFLDISAEELSEVLNCFQSKIKSYKKRDLCITLEGEKLSEIGVVLSGELAVTKENAEGQRNIIIKLGPGEIFGEIAAFSEKQFWPATVVSLGACQVMFISINKIVKGCPRQCSSHRQLILNMLKIISHKAIKLNRKVEYLTIKSMRGKISAFLLERYKKAGQKKLKLSLTRQELADFLHVSRPSLSREMGRMRDEGIIEFKRELIEIKDLEALKRAT